MWAIAIVLLILWVLGVVAFKVTAGIIHVLLIAALVVFVVKLVKGRGAA